MSGPTAAVALLLARAGAAGAREYLLVCRGKAPRAGAWSLPGGRHERGETAAQGALRELREETGVPAAALRVAPAPFAAADVRAEVALLHGRDRDR